jgi:hypothetical protein
VSEKPEPKKRRESHRTQWAAQFAVASELCKRGYEVALTMGNHPRKDIMVSSPSGVDFSIDVKGLYKQNFWAVRKKVSVNNLFYVLAFVPDDKANRFFVLTQAEVNDGVDRVTAIAAEGAKKRGLEGNWTERFPGVAWAYAAEFENNWDKLPA